MSNNTVSSRVLGGVFFAVLLAVSGIASCGSGGGSTTVITPTALTLSLAPSRTSGVAPLAVFFDASGTTDAGVTTRPFHDLEYRWDFGDTAGSPVNGTTWSMGSGAGVNSRNAASGPVSAHVYESAGTYTATLSVFDGTNTVTKSTTITVTNPETAFATTTACIANGVLPVAGAGGCPAVATLFYNASIFDTALSTAINAGARRILYRRGDAFAANGQYTISVSGPGNIGAYGTLAVPYISMATIGQYASILKPSTTGSDWRIMDLAFDGTGTTDQFAIGYSSASAQTTILRVAVTNLMAAVNLTSQDQLAVVDSNFSLGATNSSGSNGGVYCATCTNLMLMGNSIYLNTINSHNIRLQGVVGFVVSNSTQIGGDRIEPITVRGNTQYGMLSDNKFIDNIVTVKPQNSGTNEFQHDIIFELNWFVAGSYTNPSLSLEGSGITVRNNIFDISLASGYRAINIAYNNTAGSPMPDLVKVYNNTIYNSFANNGNLSSFIAINYYSSLNATCHSVVENNLAYSPNTTGTAPVLLSNAGSCVVTGASGTYGNSFDAQIKNTSPNFVSAAPSNPVDFSITTGSYAHNTGVAIPVFSDFFRTVRPQGSAIDIGAVEIP